MKRKSISKSVRFEVFKRDKFTCQYCGAKAPDVVLHVDHIKPVSKDGENNIMNFATSCYECNLGKSDRELSDDSVVKKQHKQLELLQERREQIELMFEWKKSLSSQNDETVEMIKDFIEAKIYPIGISENGKNNLKNHLLKYGIENVLDAVDVSASAYLKYSNVNGVTEESAEIFLNKIGGILFNKNLSPIEQKLAYIKNNAKNKLGYFDQRKASILLKEYVSTLRNLWKYSDDDIMKDLDNELIPSLEKEYNWTGWSQFIEGWTESIITKAKARDKEKEENISDEVQNGLSDIFKVKDVQPKNRTKSELMDILDSAQYELEATISALTYLMKPFPNYKEQAFVRNLYEQLFEFIKNTSENKEEISTKIDDDAVPIWVVIDGYLMDDNGFYYFAEYDSFDDKTESWLLDKLQEASNNLMVEVFKLFYFSRVRYCKEDCLFLANSSLDYISGAIKGKKKKLKNLTLEDVPF